MYSYEDRLRAVMLYLKLGRRINATLRQLGYANKNSLKAWCAEFEQNRDLRRDYQRLKRRYTDEQKHRAVDHYVEQGHSLIHTIRCLGYPSRETLRAWIGELRPEFRKTITGSSTPHNMPRPRATKQQAIIALNNLLNRDFHAGAPNTKWLTDLTEIHIPAGKVYLSPIVDCFDGLVVAWNIGTRPDANLVNAMLDHAVQTLHPDEHPIIHSDRGSHYRWPEWIRRTDNAKLVRSMSKKGCSPDNAACEGFFGRLKTELIYPRNWRDVPLQDFMEQIDGYIRWYNERRIKLSLGGRSPIEYRQALGLMPI